MSKPTPVLYLDLDGTVRKGYDELGRFVNTKEDVEVFPEVPAILER
jgi:D-glycero-D-manno-heptose 1,7-bisphosphate phosphatase